MIQKNLIHGAVSPSEDLASRSGEPLRRPGRGEAGKAPPEETGREKEGPEEKAGKKAAKKKARR